MTLTARVVSGAVGPAPTPYPVTDRLITIQGVAALRALPGQAAQAVFLNDGARSGVMFWKTDSGTDNDGTRYNDGGIGSSQPGWGRDFSGAFEAGWFGAFGDGATNDSAAMQRALAAASAVGLPLVLRSGTYLVSGLSATAPLTLRGEGRSSTIIKQPDHTTTDIFTVSANIRIEGVTFDGNKANQLVATSAERTTCIYFDGSTADCLIDDCVFLNTTAAAIRAVAVGGSFKLTRSVFREQANGNGLTTSYPDTALAVFASAGVGGQLTIINNTFEQAAATTTQYAPTAIEIGGTDPNDQGSTVGASATVTANYFRNLGNTNPGVGCVDLYDWLGKSTVTGNTFYSCSGAAIKIGNAAASTVSGNAIAGQAWAFGVAAIYYNGAHLASTSRPMPDVGITGNTIKDWPNGYGIHIVGDGDSDTDGGVDDLHTRGITCTGNIIDSALCGVYLDGVADSNFTGNIVKNSTGTAAGTAGMLVTRCCGELLFSGNQILDGAGYGLATSLVTQTDTRLILKGNTFRSSVGGGYFQVYAHSLDYFEASGNTFFGTTDTLVLGTESGAGPDTPVARIVGNFAEDTTVSVIATSYVHHSNSWDTTLTASQALVTDASKNVTTLAYASAATASALAQRDGSGNGAFAGVTASSFMSVGATPGSTGQLRLTKNAAIAFNGVRFGYVDSSDVVRLGDDATSGSTYMFGGAVVRFVADANGAEMRDGSNNVIVKVGASSTLGFFGTTPAAKQTVTGAVTSISDANAKAAIQSIIAALVAYGQWTDGTT